MAQINKKLVLTVILAMLFLVSSIPAQTSADTYNDFILFESVEPSIEWVNVNDTVTITFFACWNDTQENLTENYTITIRDGEGLFTVKNNENVSSFSFNVTCYSVVRKTFEIVHVEDNNNNSIPFVQSNIPSVIWDRVLVITWVPNPPEPEPEPIFPGVFVAMFVVLIIGLESVITIYLWRKKHE